jgi:hypothetical protein
MKSEFDRRNFLPTQTRGKRHDRFEDRRGHRWSSLYLSNLHILPKSLALLYPIRKKQPPAKAYNQNRCLHAGGKKWPK